MRFCSFVLFVLLLSISSSAQKISVGELIEFTKCTDLECYTSVVSLRGFEFQKITTTSKGETHHYLSKDRYETHAGSGISTPDRTRFGIYPDGVFLASYGTVVEKNYAALQQQLAELGFSLEKTNVSGDGTTSQTYINAEYAKMTIMMQKPQLEKDGANWILYETIVFQKS